MTDKELGMEYHFGQNDNDIMRVKSVSEKQQYELLDKVSSLLKEKAKSSLVVPTVPTITSNNTGSVWKNEDLKKLKRGFGGKIFPLFPNMLGQYDAESQKKVKEILGELPDIPNVPIFVFPLWLGRDESSSIMGVLNHVYKNHGDLPVNGLFIVQDALNKWFGGMIAADITNVYVTLYGINVMPPQDVSCNENGDWDISCKILGAEFLKVDEEETHGTPLRISLSVNSNDAYAICKEIHDRGKFYLEGECIVEQNDVVGFTVTKLCYDSVYEIEPQILLGDKNIDDAGHPF